MDRCRSCEAELREDLAWCPRCQTPRAEPGPVYGAITEIRPEPAPLPAWEWSVRGFGSGMRWSITAGIALLVLSVALWWNVLFAVAAAAASGPVLKDVWGRHRWAR